MVKLSCHKALLKMIVIPFEKKVGTGEFLIISMSFMAFIFIYLSNVKVNLFYTRGIKDEKDITGS